jgi:CTP synthase
MRLGRYDCVLTPNSKCAEIYGKPVISERHRHRYEVNPKFREVLEEKGLRAGGVSPDGTLVELVEFADHPWFVGCQFHPEFKSRPMDSHPLFASYIKACLEYQKSGKKQSENKE